MSEAVITVRGLSKLYRIGARRDPYRTFRDAITEAVTKPFRRNSTSPEETIWALKDVSFDIQQGEVVGVIGRNGAGKSTLLKILSEITYPTEGRVEIRGRVGSLLEVGTGFHPELTGRENIFLNGAILGMRRGEIHRKFDEIVAFAEVEKFIDTPVKRYSSGMYVRLAFAVAAHLEPEILLVDEVLAVGDVQFQKKCLGKMSEVARGAGRTILFVSHNMAAVEALCTKCILLDQGHLAAWGDTEATIGQYLQCASDVSGADVDLTRSPGRVTGFRPVAHRFRIRNASGQLTGSVPLLTDVIFDLDVRTENVLHNVAVFLHFYNGMGQRVLTLSSRHQRPEPIEVTGLTTLSCRFPRCSLLPGSYRILLSVAEGYQEIDRIDPAVSFDVVPRDVFGTGRLPAPRDGVYVADAEWEVSAGT